MRVYTVVPVREALHVDDIANLKTFNSLVNVSGVVAEIRLNGEGVGLSVQGNVEVQITVGISRTGTIPVVQESSAALGLLNSHSLEGNELVLIVDQTVGAKQISNVGCLCDVAAILDLEGSALCDLNLAGPLGLVTGNLDLVPGTSFALSSSEQGML